MATQARTIVCANEYCLYEHEFDGELPEFPYCDWCLQRKFLIQSGMPSQKQRAERELRYPWRGYKLYNIPPAIQAKYAEYNKYPVAERRAEKRQAANRQPTVSPTAPVRPPPEKPVAPQSGQAPDVSQNDDVMSPPDSDPGLLAKQLRNARANFDRIQGHDQASCRRSGEVS